MLQDPEGLRNEGLRRREEQLVRAHLARLLEGEGEGITFRRSLANALRRLAERIDSMEPGFPRPVPPPPDRPGPAA